MYQNAQFKATWMAHLVSTSLPPQHLQWPCNGEVRRSGLQGCRTHICFGHRAEEERRVVEGFFPSPHNTKAVQQRWVRAGSSHEAPSSPWTPVRQLSAAALQSFDLPFSWLLPQEISTFLLPPPSESELFLAVILWWQLLVFSYEPELELSSCVCTDQPQKLRCVIAAWSPRKVLSHEDGLPELLCYFPLGPAKSPASTATAVTQTLSTLGPKPRLVPYFTEAELLPEANEWWSTVNWPSSELMIPRWTVPFIQSPLLPISFSTFTFNWIWWGGQYLSGFADLGWMQHMEKIHASISSSSCLYPWPKQSMTCWQTHPGDGENEKSTSF